MEGYNVATLTDQSGQNDITLEVNPRSGEVADVVKLRLGDKTAIIKIRDLYNFVWVIANSEMQTELTPVQKTNVYVFERQHHVVAQKNIKKGEHLVVNCKIDVPVETVKQLQGVGGPVKPVVSF